MAQRYHSLVAGPRSRAARRALGLLLLLGCAEDAEKQPPAESLAQTATLSPDDPVDPGPEDPSGLQAGQGAVTKGAVLCRWSTELDDYQRGKTGYLKPEGCEKQPDGTAVEVLSVHDGKVQVVPLAQHDNDQTYYTVGDWLVADAAVTAAAAEQRNESAAKPATKKIERSCCKRCSNGKPCGDSCIARSKTCHKPPGCAC